MNKHFSKLLIILLLCQAFLLFPIGNSNAAATVPYFVPQQLDTNVNAEICIGANNGGFPAGFIFEMEFSPDVLTHNWMQDLTISDTDTASEFSMFYNTNSSNPCSGGTERIAEVAPDDQADRDLVEIVGNKLRLTISDNIPAGNWFGFKFIDRSDVNANALKTPAVAGNYQVTLRAKMSITSINWDIANYADLVYVGNLNQTDITASVDPTLTLTLGDFEPGYTEACPLGTFEVDKLAACGYSATVVTNSTNGYTTYIRQDHALWNLADNTKVFTAVTDGEVTPVLIPPLPTVEEYGLTTLTLDSVGDFPDYAGSDCLIDIRDKTTGQAAAALANTDKVLATYASAVDGSTHGKTYLCHVARRHAATVAGNYSQTITITAVGNF